MVPATIPGGMLQRTTDASSRDEYCLSRSGSDNGSQRFFSDFLVELDDGRVVIVEDKGGHLAEQRKTIKGRRGQACGARSGGKCLFARAIDREWVKLESVTNVIAPR
jgi:hypothetical protein